MIFMKKFFYILIFIPLLILGCKYTPIYSNKDNFNFKIENIQFNGDAEINNLIDKKLKKFKKTKSDKKISILTFTSYDKISQSKNLSGKTTDYLVEIKTTFKIEIDNKTKTLIFKEQFLVKNFSNKFEENNFEKIKKENSIDLIINKLIAQISQI
tara:strand:+ start:435 stop:899 length:465 start_codon:yes stop_codon:yes gene_type:complete